MTDITPVVKNPLSPVEHPGGLGVNCELFELGVEQFVVRSLGSTAVVFWKMLIIDRAGCVPSELIVSLSYLSDVAMQR